MRRVRFLKSRYSYSRICGQLKTSSLDKSLNNTEYQKLLTNALTYRNPDKRTQPNGHKLLEPETIKTTVCQNTVLYCIHQVNNVLYMEQVNILFRVGRTFIKTHELLIL